MPSPTKNRTYQGYSTVVGDGLSTLYDAALIKQDLLNVFNTHKGEDITDPSRGSIIWDMIFELATQENINLMTNDTVAIFQSDPRVTLLNLSIIASTDPSLPGYTLNAQLQYNGLKVAGNFIVNFFNSLVDTGV